jgi:general secretion pathway protein N
MPASRSTNRNAERAPPRGLRPRGYLTLVALALLAALVVLAAALPASFATRFLPDGVQARDLSGSIWHGEAGQVSVRNLDLGAIEWQIHPGALLQLTLAADVQWVHRGFGLTGRAALDRHAVSLTAIQGGGSIEDLRDLGVAPGWSGTAQVAIDTIASDFARLLAVSGSVQVSDLASARVAGGADLGAYVLRLSPTAVDASGGITGQLSDAGGPLAVQGTITITPQQHTGLVSGTLQERADTPAELRSELADLVQMRGRDSRGRIPIDLEFSF